MSNTDPTDQPPPGYNGVQVSPFSTGGSNPFSPRGDDFAAVAQRVQAQGRLPQTNRAIGTRMALADIGTPGGAPAPQDGFPQPPDDQARDAEAQQIGPQYPVPQNYIPASRDAASQYGYGNLPPNVTPGDDGWSTSTPTTMQSYRVAQNSSQALGLWGSPAAAPYASAAAGLATPLVFLLNAISGGRFTHNFDAARLGVLKAQQQQMYNNLVLANENERWSLQHYGELLIVGKDEKSTIQAMRDAALAHPGGPDQAMLDALDNGGLQRARTLLDDRNAHFIDNSLSAAQLRKANPGLTADQAYEPGAGAGGAGYHRLLPGEQGYDPARPGQVGPGPGPQTEAAPVNETPPKYAMDDELMKKYGANLAENQESDNVLRGEPSELYQRYGNTDTLVRQKIDHMAADKRNRINQIANEPPDTDGTHPERSASGKLARIRAISPGYAQGLEAIRGYDINPTSISEKNDVRYHQLKLVTAIDPNYKQAKYDMARKMLDTSGLVQKNMQNSAMMPTEANNILRLLDQANRDDKTPPENFFASLSAKYWDGDPYWTELWNAIQNYSISSSSILSRSGAARVTLVKTLQEHIGDPRLMSATIRGAVQIGLSSIVALVKQHNQDWKTLTGRDENIPGLGDVPLASLKSYMLMNPYTNRFPEDSPLPQAMLGQAHPDPDNLPSWWQPFMNFVPMSIKEFDDIESIYNKLPPNSPQRRAIVNKLRERGIQVF
jgi:hypothetical protein